jgi:antirestriction protein ArdC
MNNNVYKWVTERIVEALGKGKIPWRQPWFGTELAPRNLVSGKPYRGINSLLLACLTYESPYFLTYSQATKRGGKVKKGEKGHMVVFYKLWDVPGATDENGRQKRIPLLRYYKVFNVTQCEGIDYPKPEPRTETVNPIDECEAVWNSWADRPEVVTGNRACYNRAADKITMPNMQLFDGPAKWYSTLYHEGIHATGHESRIGRDFTGGFGSGSYSFEELIAELGAAMLCGRVGIVGKTIENSQAYCQSWASKLKADEKLIVRAAAKGPESSGLHHWGNQNHRGNRRRRNRDRLTGQRTGQPPGPYALLHPWCLTLVLSPAV